MSRCFVLSRGTQGLVVRFNLKCKPSMKVENYYKPMHTMARASFSIWAYLCSVSVSAFEANATGFHEPCSSWNRTAPKPYDEASVDILVATWGLYNARVDGFVISCFRAAKARSCFGLHYHTLRALSNSLSGWVRSAMRGENLLNWFIIPKNRRSSETSLGLGII